MASGTPPIVLVILLFSLAGILLLLWIIKYITFYRQTTPGYTKSERELESDKAYQKKKGQGGASNSTEGGDPAKPKPSGQIDSEGGTILGFALMGLGMIMLISAFVLIFTTFLLGVLYAIVLGALGILLFFIGLFVAIGSNVSK